MNIKLNEISYSYGKNNEVLKNITTSFDFGKIYLLFGKNGAGKSTLANILSEYILPTNGKIEFPKKFHREILAIKFRISTLFQHSKRRK